MRRILRYSLTAFLLALACGVCMAQTDRKEVRAGNRQYRKGNWQNAEIEYRKAQAIILPAPCTGRAISTRPPRLWTD